jgi:N-acetylglucosaminyldiphosphoundecaprenol N-acetyl-beta-D-mannosaminyltransferase
LGGWTVCGRHHGSLAGENLTAEVLRRIAAAQPDLLLVGMGNPLQEQWFHAHRRELDVPLVIGVGGLLNFWSGNVPRAPAWLRRWGAEWLWVLCQQPHKARRYLAGNPLFLARVLKDWWRHGGPDSAD